MFKVVVSGHVTEIYEYTRQQREVSDEQVADADKQERRDEERRIRLAKARYSRKKYKAEHPESILDNKRRANSIRRDMIRRLAIANFRPGDKFITLTYAEGTPDKECYNLLKRYLKKWKRANPTIEYLAVAERQENGTIHFHMVAHGIKRTMCNEWPYIWESKTIMKKHDNIGAYLIKYMTKDIANLPKNCPAYKASKGLTRPTTYHTLSNPIPKGEEKNAAFKTVWRDYYGCDVNYHEFNQRRPDGQRK